MSKYKGIYKVIAAGLISTVLCAGCHQPASRVYVSIRYDETPQVPLERQARCVLVHSLVCDGGSQACGDTVAKMLVEILSNELRGQPVVKLGSQKSESPQTSQPDVQLTGMIHIREPAEGEDLTMLGYSIQITEIQTGKTIAALTGSVQAKAERTEDTAAKGCSQALLRLCAEDMAARLLPRRHVIRVSPAGDHGEQGRLAREAVMRGQYDRALKMYHDAMGRAADDHAAIFNAALMCEMLGIYQKAQEYYDQAVRLDANPAYVQGRERVRKVRAGELKALPRNSRK